MDKQLFLLVNPFSYLKRDRNLCKDPKKQEWVNNARQAYQRGLNYMGQKRPLILFLSSPLDVRMEEEVCLIRELQRRDNPLLIYGENSSRFRDGEEELALQNFLERNFALRSRDNISISSFGDGLEGFLPEMTLGMERRVGAVKFPEMYLPGCSYHPLKSKKGIIEECINNYFDLVNFVLE